MAIILCSFEGCDRKHHGKGLCEPHYHQQRRGSKLVPLRDQRTVEWRLDQKTNKTDSCWLWEGPVAGIGYGYLYFEGKMRGTHVLSYERYKGNIPEGMVIDHMCHVKTCVNPDHLRLATRSQNSQNKPAPQSNNTSGFTGVYYYKSRDKYTSYIEVGGKRKNLGYFKTIEEAWEARKSAELELFSHTNLKTAL